MASPWRERPVWELLQQNGVRRIVVDQCQLGQQIDAGDPLRNPIGFMHETQELLQSLDRRCFGKHWLCSRPEWGRQAECLGRKAQMAAIFQEAFRLTIFWGFRNRLPADSRMRKTKSRSCLDLRA